MLGSMRSRNNMPVIYVILGLLILGLIGFGGSQLGQSGPDSFGTLGKVDLEIDDYVNQYQGTAQQLEQAIGRRLSMEEAEQFGLFQSALSQVVNNAAIDNLNAELGLSVGDEAVARDIQGNINFQQIGGGFDREAYQAALRRNDLSPAEFENRVRRDNARTMTQIMLLGGAASHTATATTLMTYARESRDFEFARVTADALESLPTAPGDDTLRAFYDANPEDYTALETKAVRYVILRPEDLVDTIEIDDALLREAYDDQLSRFNQPARRAVDRLIYPSADAAEDARNRLDGGVVTFDALVAERGLTIADIDQGEVTETALPSAVSDVIFGSDDLGVVGPVDTDLGPALYRINAIFDASETSFEEAKPELQAELAQDEAARAVLGLAGEIEDLLAAGASFAEIADETAMEQGSISIDAETREGVAAYAELRQAVAAAKPGDFAELLDLSDGGIFAVEVDEIIPPALRPFADVKADVTADWLAEETQKAIVAKAEDFLTEVKLGTAFETLGLEAEQRFETTRDAFIEGTPSALVEEAFGLGTNAPDNVAVIEGTDAAFLVRVTKITPADLTSEDAVTTIDALTAEIGTQLSRELYEAYAAELGKQADINLGIVQQLNLQLTGSVAGLGN